MQNYGFSAQPNVTPNGQCILFVAGGKKDNCFMRQRFEIKTSWCCGENRGQQWLTQPLVKYIKSFFVLFLKHFFKWNALNELRAFISTRIKTSFKLVAVNFWERLRKPKKVEKVKNSFALLMRKNNKQVNKK